MQTRRFFQFAAILVVLALLLSACAPAAAPAPAPAQPAEQPTAAPAPAEPTAAPAGEKMTVAGVVFQSDTFMQTVQAGMQAAADEAGAELILGNTENDLAKESSMIDDYITRGVKAILITPISSDGSVAALKKAKDAGITIICFNTCVSEPGIASGFLVTKNEDLGTTTGVAAAKFITEQLGGKAVVGMLNCDQFEGCPPRKEGFMAEMAKLPGVKSPPIRPAGSPTTRCRSPKPCSRPIPRSTCCGLPTKAARSPMLLPSTPPVWPTRFSSSAPT